MPFATMTQGDALTQLRQRLAETTAAQWTDTELRTWINEGMRDLARRTEALEAPKATVAVTAAAQTYSAPTDLLRIHRLEYAPSGENRIIGLEYQDFNNLDQVWFQQQTVTVGDPALYTMWGHPPNTKIILYPTPTKAGSLYVYYYRIPTDLATTTTADANTTLDVPAGWTDLIIDYAEYRALRRSRDSAWQDARQTYEQSVDQLITNSRRWTDQSGGGWVSQGTQMLPPWLVQRGY